MKKLRALFAVLFLFTSASVFADDFDWSKCWCNYGAGIEKGDILLSVDTGVSWDFLDAYNSGGWAIPYVLADVEIACPVWKLPFTFGGYVGFGMNEYHYSYYEYGHTLLMTGGSATYHVRMPPKNLDLYTGLKLGFRWDFSDEYDSGHYFNVDWGYNIGASWYFNSLFGVNAEFGYPINKVGVIFKF